MRSENFGALMAPIQLRTDWYRNVAAAFLLLVCVGEDFM